MWLTRLLSLIPTVVLGIERIHGDAKAGADKKQLAMEALQLAIAGTTGIAPPQLQPVINAASGLASTVIDGTVSLFNKIGWPDTNSRTAKTIAHWTRIK